MPLSFQTFALKLISGQDRSPLGRIIRSGMAIVEPFYAAIMRVRNWCFDHRLKQIHDLGRFTISVGNITTGGTGKTPFVLWLASQLRARGYHPAILLRGYGSTILGVSDEQQLLDQALNPGPVSLQKSGAGSLGPDDNKPGREHFREQPENIPPQRVYVRAGPSRVDSARKLLLADPSIDVFILDDGFQHRKANRDLDLVLISATEPFGYGHVLPRGLLREPLSGLTRASAFLITRSSLGDLPSIEAKLAAINPGAPIFRSEHIHSAVRTKDGRVPPTQMVGEKVFVFAGIGDPEPFAQQLATIGCEVVGYRWFADHHAYTPADIADLTAAGKAAHATWLITTAKDHVKMADFPETISALPIAVAELSIVMLETGNRSLLDHILEAIKNPAGPRDPMTSKFLKTKS